MNKIKDSFSKIKASDEFKDKLKRELLASPIKLKSTKKRLYYRSSIAAASVLLILIGTIGVKSVINIPQTETSELDSIAYNPEESATSSVTDDSVNESNDSASKSDISTKSNQSDTPSNSEITTNKITANKNVDSNNLANSTNSVNNIVTPPAEIISPNTGVTNENKNITSDATVNSNTMIKSMAPTPDATIASVSDASMASDISMASDTTVSVPKLQLPEANAAVTAKMMPLIVYKGNIYIYTPIQIPSEKAKNLLGRKIGTTKGGINEWSTQSDYSNNLASNIGITDVYAVNGYDEDFRIMTNITLEDGNNYPEFYECLNGITVKDGSDVFGKLKLQGNITQAKFQAFSDWNNGTGTFYQISNLNLIDNLIDELNKATPYLPEDIETSLGDYRNDDEFKQISLDLKDGSKNITFTILKSGYVYYGYPQIYFKIDDKFCAELWDQLGIMRIN